MNIKNMNVKKSSLKVDRGRCGYVRVIIIIYHDFPPTYRRGSHVKSGKTHTQSSRYTP